MRVIDPHGLKAGKLRVVEPHFIKESVTIDVSADVTIEKNVTMADDVVVLTHEHYLHTRRPQIEVVRELGVQTTPKWIGEDAWIGARAMILPKCSRIGRGAVIGAGAVVTKGVPEYEIWAGNPARKIGERR